jgi:hypothetical protein
VFASACVRVRACVLVNVSAHEGIWEGQSTNKDEQVTEQTQLGRHAAGEGDVWERGWARPPYMKRC